ncbi:MAG: hypothetical protein KDE51_22505 [Anaerolineales bacterium]|nr:hypothetical protein [Anaerolineales bacterium]
MSQKDQLSRNDAIEIIAAELTGPTRIQEFTTRVLEIWPSNAKDPHAGVRQAMKGYDHQGKTLLYLDNTTITSMQLAMAGVQWRVSLSAGQLAKGILYIIPAFAGLKPRWFDNANLQLVDASDLIIPTEIVEETRRVNTIFGESTQKLSALNLSWWYKKHQVEPTDHLLITIVDWSANKYRLEIERHTAYQAIQDEVATSNALLMDQLFGALEGAKDERVFTHIVITAAYAHLKEKQTVPADHWLQLIEQDGRMVWNGYEIGYADSLTSLGTLFSSESPQSAAPPKLTAAQQEQVYQFKAYLKHKKSLWRRIEIQGEQILKDFDDIMRHAFLFDAMDHLSGFWQRIRRGDTNKFREVDLATIYPYGDEGEGGDTQIAALDLQPGDQLKYVYDFGDWIECYIELEEIIEAAEAADYPRVVAQNKPRYRYCPVCKTEGKKTIATYVCYWCSNEQQKDVLMCEEHISPEHEDHYLEEMLY